MSISSICDQIASIVNDEFLYVCMEQYKHFMTIFTQGIVLQCVSFVEPGWFGWNITTVPQTANVALASIVLWCYSWFHLQSIVHLLSSKLTQMCHLHVFQHNQVPYKCKHSWAFAFTCWITACYVPISYMRMKVHCIV